MTNKAVFRAFWGTVYCTSFRCVERLPGNGSLPGTRFLLTAKESSQRKLPLFRRSGPATKGLHAPWIPKAEVAECAGYANAVLLFALNARALCSVLKLGCSPEPPRFLTAALHLGRQPAKGSPFRGAGRASWPEGSRRALRHHQFPVNHPPTAKREGCRPPLPLSCVNFHSSP